MSHKAEKLQEPLAHVVRNITDASQDYYLPLQRAKELGLSVMQIYNTHESYYDPGGKHITERVR